MGAMLVAVSPCSGQSADPFPVYATDACSSNSWLIPFDQGKAGLGAFAQQRLDDVMAAWHVDYGPILASGRVDGNEEGHDPGLAQRRLQIVAEALIKRGLPGDAIWTRDDGGQHGFVENRPGLSEPQNRIVLLVLARGGDQCARNLAKARAQWLGRNCSPSHRKAAAAACEEAMSRLE